MNRSIPAVLTISAVMILMTACASKNPSFGDSVEAEGKAVAGIGKKWEKGRQLVKDGNKRIRKGNKQIDNGTENVADGKAMVKSGERLIDEAEKAYSAAKANQ